jgi:hypothetical protein
VAASLRGVLEELLDKLEEHGLWYSGRHMFMAGG